jgi:hypothetical protein
VVEVGEDEAPSTGQAEKHEVAEAGGDSAQERFRGVSE